MKIFNQVVAAIIDTGSSVSIVNFELVKDKVIKGYNGPLLKSASGCYLDVIGVISLKLNDTFSSSFIVVKDFIGDCLIGMDILKNYNGIININKNLILGGISFKFVNDSSINITLVDTFMVPARSEMLLKAKVDAVCEPVVLVEPKNMNKVSFARCLTRVVNGCVTINCINTSTDSIKLYAGTSIGTAESFSVESEVNCGINPDEIKQLVTDSEINETERKELYNLLLKYVSVFSWDGKPGRTNVIKHRIKTGNATAISKKPYRTSIAEQETIKKEIDKMLEEGIIKHSSSPWASPVVLVRKKDGKVRFCVDYRGLNAVTERDVYPLPLINDALETLAGCNLFTTLDCLSGYWQVEVQEEDKAKTAFITKEGLYQFEVMPFGLANGPATFQRLMDFIMNGIKWKRCMIYLDDIIVFSKSFQEHLENLEEVFIRLKQSGLKLKPSKCSFAKKKITYLGHVISSEGVTVDLEKVKAVKEFRTPKNVKQLQQFLGLAGYYRRFIKGFAGIASPLFENLKKDVKFNWNQNCEEAFNQIKECLMKEPILKLPDFTKTFTIYCDASGKGIGAILSQDFDGKEHVISYYSRSLTNAEQKYTTLERECLALIDSIKHFKQYLYMKKFIVVVDNNPLTWLKTAQFVSSRLMRWATEIQSYDFEIKYRKGKNHTNADTLSRSQEDVFLISKMEDWKSYQEKDLEIEEEVKKKNYVNIDGIVYYVSKLHNGTILKRIVVPDALKNEVLVWCHDHITSGHLGITKTLERIKQRFYWKNYKKEVENYIEKCEICSKRRNLEKIGTLTNIKVGEPWEMIAVDIVGPLPITDSGNKYILVFSDYLTKYPEAFAIKDYTTETIAKILVEEVVLRYGFPSKLLSDRGTSFLSKLAKCVYKLLDIKKLNTTSYHPQTDGLVERFNRTLIEMISKFVDENQTNWDSFIPYLLYAYRTSVHGSTKFTPYYLMFGREAKLPIEIALNESESKVFNANQYGDLLMKGLAVIREKATDNIEKSQIKQKLNYDKDKEVKSYNVGDLVWYYKEDVQKGLSRKFVQKWHGPFVIVKRINDLNYRIRELNKKKKNILTHISKLKPYIGEIKDNEVIEEKEIIDEEKTEMETEEVIADKDKVETSSEEFKKLDLTKIEKILDVRFRRVKKNRRKYYQVLFQNGEKKWIPLVKLKPIDQLIKEFDTSRSKT